MPVGPPTAGRDICAIYHQQPQISRKKRDFQLSPPKNKGFKQLHPSKPIEKGQKGTKTPSNGPKIDHFSTKIDILGGIL
jgi:hypothetical protein